MVIRGCVPILLLTIFGSIICLVSVVTKYATKRPIPVEYSEINSVKTIQGAYTKAGPIIGIKSINAMPNATNGENGMFRIVRAMREMVNVILTKISCALI